jgi:hypothetical protein
MTGLWFIQSIAALAYPRYKEALGVQDRALTIYLFAISFHFIGAVWLSNWTLYALKFIVAPLGLWIWWVAIRELWRHFTAKFPNAALARGEQ